jgi:hypothetical protein
MALDEPKEDDEIIRENGITYLINKELFEDAKPISVDFVESAFPDFPSLPSLLHVALHVGPHVVKRKLI